MAIWRCDLHAHTTYCDGKDGIQAMVEAAKAAGLDAFGLSGHSPLPFETDWAMRASDLGAYAAEVREARATIAGGMELYLGLEIDYILGVQSARSPSFLSIEPDYLISSVHWLKAPDGSLVTVDGPHDEFLKGFEGAYGGDAGAFIRDYFLAVEAMIREGGFDIVGHFDLPKMRNGKGGKAYFDVADPAYMRAACACLDMIADAGIAIELNMGGVIRGRSAEPYPSRAILAGCARRGIPVCVNSDAHAASHVGAMREEAYAILRGAGLKEIAALKEGRWMRFGL
jgi:histidinol-phosphatase (PHP family)